MSFPDPNRYDACPPRYCGQSGLPLPQISMGFWNNFSPNDDLEKGRRIILRAFDLGIVSMDLSNNYGEPFFGDLLRSDLGPYRDELIIGTKVGYRGWPGHFGTGTSRKAIRVSVDRSLARLGTDYLDILYAHRHDPQTPVEETMRGFADMVRAGKVLYIGISNFGPVGCQRAAEYLAGEGIPLLIHEVKYSMLTRGRFEGEVAEITGRYGFGTMAYCPLEQGILTERYLEGIPSDSRAANEKSSFKMERLTEERRDAGKRLKEVANERGQTLVEMAFNWVLEHPQVTSALTGASRPEQLEATVAGLKKNRPFSEEERGRIDEILGPVLLD